MQAESSNVPAVPALFPAGWSSNVPAVPAPFPAGWSSDLPAVPASFPAVLQQLCCSGSATCCPALPEALEFTGMAEQQFLSHRGCILQLGHFQSHTYTILTFLPFVQCQSSAWLCAAAGIVALCAVSTQICQALEDLRGCLFVI